MRPATLAKTTTGVVLAAVVGGVASRPAQSDWYEKLRKPGFQPPRQAFPIVWPLLYADIAAVSAATVGIYGSRAAFWRSRMALSSSGFERIASINDATCSGSLSR